MKRASGLLLPVTSIPSKYGIGCFSKEAYQWIDQLKEVIEMITGLETEMYAAARKLDFERATVLRDSIIELKATYKIG